MLVEDTGHCIMCDQPDIVIEAVRDVIEAVRTQGKLSSRAAGSAMLSVAHS
jgi:hypothetical protein